MLNTSYYLISVTVEKFHWFAVNSWYKKRTLLWQKTRNAKNLKIKFQQRRVKPKCSIDKKTKILPILFKFNHQNLNFEIYFYLCAIISRKKFAIEIFFSNKQCCYQENQILPAVTRFNAMNSLKTKMALLSFFDQSLPPN